MDDQSFTRLGSSQMRAGEHAVVAFFTTKLPLFSSLASFESTEPQLLVILGIVVYMCQHIGFLINPHFSDVLGYILGGDLANIFYGFHFPIYDPLFVDDATPQSLIALVFVTLAAGLALYALTMYYRVSGANTDKMNPVFVLVNRLVLHGMSTFLLIPALQICIAGMTCGEHGSMWHYAGRSNVDASDIKCWGSTHLATFIPSAIFVAAVLPLLYLALGCQFETRNTSDHLKARRNSLVDEIGFAHDVISCVLFQVLLAYDMRGAFAVLHAVGALAVAAAYAFYLPFYDFSMNQLFSAVHAVEGAMSVIIAAALLNPSFALSASASAMIIGLAPFAALYAAVLASYRVNPLFVHVLQQCRSGLLPFVPTAKIVFPHGLSDDSTFAPFPDLENQVIECVTRQDAQASVSFGLGKGTGNGRDSLGGGDATSMREIEAAAKNQREILASFIDTVRVPADVDLAASFPQVFERIMGERPTLRMLIVASRIFSRGLITFPMDSFVLYRFTSFIVEYIPTMSFVGLEMIDSMTHNVDTSIILRYRAYHTAQELRMALGIRNQAHLLHSKRARQKHSGVLSLMHNFWMKLTEPSVNIGQVSEIADQINGSRQEALLQFRRALQHQTSSDALLVHRMGDFLRDVMMDSEGATECYNEAKEIHEARQARSMRGTKQHTTVELDVETLTDRLMYLLEGKRDNNANSTSAHSSVVQYLLYSVTIIFTALLAIAVLFLYVAVDQQTNLLNSADRVKRMASLRHQANMFASNLLGVMAATTSAQRAPLYAQMAARLAEFSDSFASITSGEFQTDDQAQVDVLTDAMVPTYIATQGMSPTSGYALWSLGEELISHMRALVQYSNTTALNEHNSHVDFVLHATMPTAYAFDHMVTLAEDKVASDTTRVTVWTVALVVVGVVIVILTYLAFLVSFRRTALSRIFTFQLFTLIPFDDLEKLASDTKDKVQAIIEENRSSQQQQQQQQQQEEGQTSTSNSAGDGASPLADLASDKGDENQSNSSSSRKASLAGRNSQNTIFTAEYNGMQLKSCLKKGNQPKPAKGTKRVMFNPVVETVGGKDDDTIAVASVRRDSTGAMHTEDDGGSDEPLLLEKRAGDTVRKTRSTDGYSPMQKAAFMASFGFMVAICVVSMILLGISYGATSDGSTAYTNAFTSRIDVWNDVSDSVVTLQSEVLKFLFDGSEVHYTNYVAQMVDLNHVLLDSVGIAKENVAAVTNFRHDLSDLITKQLDVIALGARYYHIDLKEYPEIRTRVLELSDSAYFASMKAKYPERYAAALQRNAGLNVTGVSLLDFAWSIITDHDVYSCDVGVQSILLEVVESFHAKALADVDHASHPASTIAALALLVLCAVLALCMMIPDIDLLTSDHVGRIHFAVLFVLMAIPIGITASSWEKGGDVTITSHNVYRHMKSVLDAKTRSTAMLTQTRMYTITGETSYFFCASSHDKLDDDLQSLTPVLKEAGLMSVAVASHLDAIYNAQRMIGRLSSIGTAIAIAGYANYVAPEVSMIQRLGNTTWWYIKEEEYLFTEQMFPSRTPKYSERTKDLTQLSRRELVETAMATVLDNRASLYVLSEEKYFTYLLSNVSHVSRDKVSSAVSSVSSFTIIALITCAIPIAWCLVIAVRLAHLFTLVLGLQASTNTNSMDMSVYAVLVRRCQYGLLLIAALLALTFAIGIWVSQSSKRPIHELNLATQRNYRISQSLYHVRALFTNVSEAVSAHVLLEDRTRLRDVAKDVYFGDPEAGSFFAVGKNSEFDALTFGPVNTEASARSLMSYLTDVCGDLIDGGILPFPSRGPFSEYHNPTQLGVFYWRVLLGKMSLVLGGLNPTTSQWSSVQSYANTIYGISEALTDSLDAGDEILYHEIVDQSKLRSGIFIAASVLSIVGVVLVYVLVIVPIIQRLVGEEESAKLLLRMIPVHVRDQVPAISEFIETGKIDNAAELQKKFEASEKLLQNILPQKIANRLKSGEQPIADTHPCLTILFTDFVGFTKRSSSMRADEIVDFLNEVFLEFDTIVELLELEKIKTIGDAYFMAGGLDPRISDHAMRVIEAGMMFFQSLEEHNARHPDRNPLQMRLGIHTGPAVAGVIGTKKVAYDLWGESVEIANAMESTGIPGRVHISEDTVKHVTGFYRLEPRGELPREKEHIPDAMPATFLICGRLLPTPYQHIQRPRMLKAKLAGEMNK